jgi:hypothetical protein
MRLIRILLAASVAVVVTSPAAYAAPDRKLGDLLGALWEIALETPTPDNPLGGGDPCVDLDGVVAPFQLGSNPLTCTVTSETKIFVAAVTVECSTAEAPPFFGENEAQLRACAEGLDVFTTLTVTLDGEPVALTPVFTPLLRVDLPADNILGVEAQSALSVGHGWVALLHPLPPGEHVIRIEGTGTVVGDIDVTTTIVVERGRSNLAA